MLQQLDPSGSFEVGDWVRPYSRGIWRVARVLSGFNELRWSLNEPKRVSSQVLVFSNRLVNESWKRSFSREVSLADYVCHVSDDERLRIRAVLAENTRLAAAFHTFEIKSPCVDLIANFRCGCKSRKEPFATLCRRLFDADIQNGLTLEQVLERLADEGHGDCQTQIPAVASLQLVSVGHDVRDNEFVFHRYVARG